MAQEDTNTARVPFPRIRTDILGRLSKEADLRTMPPQKVDLAEIRRMVQDSKDDK